MITQSKGDGGILEENSSQNVAIYSISPGGGNGRDEAWKKRENCHIL
jgi:hypothetical protein